MRWVSPMRDEEIRAVLAERLFAQRFRLEAAARERIGTRSPVDSLKAAEFSQAVSAAISYGIEAVATADGQPPPLPSILLVRARLAAKDGTSLQALIRRYLVGFAVFGDHLLEQAENDQLAGSVAVRQLLADLANLIDRVITTVGSEYSRAVEGRLRTPSERHADAVARLVDGELLDSGELAYDFAATHLGLIAEGPAARAAADELTADLDTRRLLVEPDAESVWGWLGSRHELDWAAIAERLTQGWPSEVVLALGEPVPSLRGWRLTHRQARAALPVARGTPQGCARYGDVALLAAAHSDHLLRDSLRALYLEPLASRRDSDALRETLRAYLAADRNASSAAALLDVDRRTVTSRIRAAEECFGRPLPSCASDLEVALKLEDFELTGNGIDW